MLGRSIETVLTAGSLYGDTVSSFEGESRELREGAGDESDDDDADEAMDARLVPKMPKTFLRPLVPEEVDLTFGTLGLEVGRKKSGYG